MINKQKWIERKFDFNFPVGMFPCILERLRGTPARLEELLSTFPKNILTVRINDGWSIQEHAGHLYDLDELHEARIEDFLSGARTLRPADMKNQKTYDANYNTKPIDAVLRGIRDARMRFVAKLEGMNELQLALISLHPRLQQPMRLVDMAFFVAEHDDHHIASIVRIARTLHH